MAGLFVAGEDAGGMHGANRLGGNGVANSTVFGGIAGDVMPGWVATNPGHRPPDESVLDAEFGRALHPFTRKGGDLNRLRERLLDTMWDEVGVRATGPGSSAALRRSTPSRPSSWRPAPPGTAAPSTSPGTTGSICARSPK